MATRYYPAIIAQDSGGAYTVSFIDLDNVFSEGDTIEEAIANAQDALAGVLDVMQEHGDNIPEPTPLDTASANRKKYGDIISFQMIPVSLRGRAVKISVTMDEDLLKRVDMVAGNYGRSEFLANAAREKLSHAALSGRKKATSKSSGRSSQRDK